MCNYKNSQLCTNIKIRLLNAISYVLLNKPFDFSSYILYKDSERYKFI